MGERGVIQLKSKDLGSLCFYTHWRGDKMRRLAQEVIGFGARWDDHPYFASIMFRHLTQDYFGILDERRSHLSQIETGFGIWAGEPEMIGDQNYPPLVIDLDKRTVTQDAYDDEKRLSMTFDKVVAFIVGKRG